MVNYSTAGNKVLRYVLTYSDGSQFTTYSNLYVPRAAVFNRGPNFIDPCRTQSITADIPFLGAPGEAQVSYYYKKDASGNLCTVNTTQNVTKPVVIVDGIDYEGVREGGDIYGEYLAYRDDTNRESNLGLELRREGYDVVILDFPNLTIPIRIGPFTYNVITRHSGADYMERNAYTLVKLIQELNQQMQLANPGTTEKIVVVGPSMGGQIARYALAYMEANNNMPHNTRLFVSLDSPNNGATIPIGLQHFVSFFAGEANSQELTDGLGLLDSPASRELTLQHYSQAPLFSGPTPYRADPLRTNFLNSLSALGSYPNQVRRVAVADGALDATPQHDQNGQVIQAGDQAFLLEQRGVPPGTAGTIVRILFPIGLLGRLVTTGKGRVYYGPSYGQTARVLDAYTILSGTNNRNAVGVPNSCSLDGASGGYRNFLGFAKSDATGGLFAHAFSKRNFYSVRDRSCFIPTLSALGVSQPADNCQPAGQNLVCTGTTPFDAYYGPTGRNDEHLHLTSANVAFMRDEILNITPSPIFASAPTALCSNRTSTVTITPECSRLNAQGQPLYPTFYDWTLSGPAVFIATNTQTLTGAGNSQTISVTATSGTVTLTAVARRTGANASAPVVISLPINPDGSVDTDLDLQGAQKVCPYSTVIVRVLGTNVQAPYTWTEMHYRNGNPGFTATFTTQQPEYAVSVGDETVELTVTAQNVCTGQNVAEAPRTITPYIDPNGGFYCDPYSLRVAPNPAADYVDVSTRPDQAPPAPPLPNQANPHAFQVRLHNGRGQVVQAGSTRDGLVRLNTAELPAGLYHVVVQRGRQIIRRNLSVQH